MATTLKLKGRPRFGESVCLPTMARPGSKLCSKLSPNHSPNRRESASASQTRCKGASSLISFWMVFAVIVSICNLSVAYYGSFHKTQVRRVSIAALSEGTSYEYHSNLREALIRGLRHLASRFEEARNDRTCKHPRRRSPGRGEGARPAYH